MPSSVRTTVLNPTTRKDFPLPVKDGTIMAVLRNALLTLSSLSWAHGRAISVSGAPPKIVARKDWESPEYTWLYQFQLPIPPVKTPAM
jgi:hypothetical protein